MKIVEKDFKPPGYPEDEVTQNSKILESAPETSKIAPLPLIQNQENPEEATQQSKCASKNVV